MPKFNDSPFKGDPHWACKVCGKDKSGHWKKKFSSKGLAVQHERRVHGVV